MHLPCPSRRASLAIIAVLSVVGAMSVAGIEANAGPNGPKGWITRAIESQKTPQAPVEKAAPKSAPAGKGGDSGGGKSEPDEPTGGGGYEISSATGGGGMDETAFLGTRPVVTSGAKTP